ncbi:transposase [Streptomyces sp. NPDC002265]|uniref:transposase n=1 Tax=Streptomyces sp. NPDC002265 TaxID=3154415 RepID=UPI00332F4D75
MRDRLDGLWRDEEFADWYPRDGRPGLSPPQLATVCVLPFLLGLSDRQAAEAVRCRIDFKHAMAMKLDDPGFHHSVLAAVRDRTGPELITEAVRAALEEVAGTSPHLLDELVDEDWGSDTADRSSWVRDANGRTKPSFSP